MGKASRWWIYQRERFPVFTHGALIAAFSASAVSFSALLRGPRALPAVPSLLVGFPSAFLAFLQLRIADEFKDYAEDCAHRPYRPVPRGLVRLGELGRLDLASRAVQAALALWLDGRLLGLLLVTWLYLALMRREFFARDWLRRRPVTYLWTHMLIMPLIDLYATACDWLPADGAPPSGVVWFLVVSFWNGMVVELGRKIRAPEHEEPGVETYSALWGPRAAAAAWAGVMAVTWGGAVVAAGGIGARAPVGLALGACVAAAAGVAAAYARQPVPARARWFEPLSGAWTLLLYLALGVAPLLVRLLGRAS